MDTNMEKFKEEYQFRLSPSSLASIELAVKQLSAHTQKTIQEITSRDIRHWLIHLHHNGYAKGTVRLKFFRLQSFLKFCQEEGILSQNPLESMMIPEEEPRPPYYLNRNQLIQLRKLASGDLRQRAVLEVLCATGVRVGELCAMRREDIDWSDRMIHIQEGKGKKGRMVLFTKECAEHIKAYLQARDDDLPALFLNRYRKGPLTPSAIEFWFERYRDELGFHVTPHTLRHTFAAHLAQKGMPLEYIQVLLGHDEPRHTELYARLCNQARKEKYDEWM